MPGSKAFRQLVAKVFHVDFSKGELSWGCSHDGPSDSPLTQEEEKWRAQILHFMHSQAYAQKGVSGQKLIGVEMMPGHLGKMARLADGESHGWWTTEETAGDGWWTAEGHTWWTGGDAEELQKAPILKHGQGPMVAGANAVEGRMSKSRG